MILIRIYEPVLKFSNACRGVFRTHYNMKQLKLGLFCKNTLVSGINELAGNFAQNK